MTVAASRACLFVPVVRGPGGPNISLFFFLTFHLGCVYTMLNLFIAIILSNFHEQQLKDQVCNPVVPSACRAHGE